jgi:hypothetical protein
MHKLWSVKQISQNEVQLEFEGKPQVLMIEPESANTPVMVVAFTIAEVLNAIMGGPTIKESKPSPTIGFKNGNGEVGQC